MSGDENEFTSEELEALSLIGRARQTLPVDEFWGVAAVQNLAGIYARYKDVMTEDDRAVLIGCGAALRSYADGELKAQVQAMLAIAKARGTQ